MVGEMVGTWLGLGGWSTVVEKGKYKLLASSGDMLPQEMFNFEALQSSLGVSVADFSV